MVRRLLLVAVLALACADFAFAADAQEMNSKQFILGSVWFVAVGMAGYYFLVTRPIEQQQKKQSELVTSLKKNDEVLTTGGLYGRVVSTKPESVIIEIAPNVRVKVATANILAVPAAVPEDKGVDKKKEEGKGYVN